MEKMEPSSIRPLVKRFTESLETKNKNLQGDLTPYGRVAQSRLYTSPPRKSDADHTYSLKSEPLPSDVKAQMQIRTDRYLSLSGRVKANH